MINEVGRDGSKFLERVVGFGISVGNCCYSAADGIFNHEVSFRVGYEFEFGLSVSGPWTRQWTGGSELYTGRVDPRVGSGRQFQNTKKLKCNMLYDRLMVALLFIPHSDKCNLDE